MAGGALPEKFKTFDSCGIKGGVEMGFMSTTLNKEVAFEYAKGGAGIVFEIEQARPLLACLVLLLDGAPAGTGRHRPGGQPLVALSIPARGGDHIPPSVHGALPHPISPPLTHPPTAAYSFSPHSLS